MSYSKMIKWGKRHRKGTKQPVIAHTNSGFWPSGSFTKEWIEYGMEQEAKGLPYLSCEEYYQN